MKKTLFGFAHLCGAVSKFNDTDSVLHLLSDLLFSDSPTELERKMIKNMSNSRPEFLDGNIRTDSKTFANPDVAKYLLYRFDSDRTKFPELVFRCSQHFNSHDEKNRFIPDNYYLNADNENGVVKDFASLISMTNTSEWIKKGVYDYISSFKSFLSEQNYESALSMLILFSFLNTEVFHLNWQFKRLKYASSPSESIKKEAKYIIKPYLNQSYHLALKKTTTCMNYTRSKVRSLPIVRISWTSAKSSDASAPRFTSAHNTFSASHSGRSVAGTATQKSTFPTICVVSKFGNHSAATLFLSSSSRMLGG